jgi:hypothetical protein
VAAKAARSRLPSNHVQHPVTGYRAVSTTRTRSDHSLERTVACECRLLVSSLTVVRCRFNLSLPMPPLMSFIDIMEINEIDLYILKRDFNVAHDRKYSTTYTFIVVLNVLLRSLILKKSSADSHAATW